MAREKIKKLLQHCLGFILLFFPCFCDTHEKGYGRLGLFRVLSLHHIPDVNSFERLIEHLIATCGLIKPEEAEDLIAGKATGRTNGKIPYLLTFDDGFRSHGRLVRGVLDHYGVKAVFFICPGIMEMAPEDQRIAVTRFVFDPPIPETEVTEGMLPLSWHEAEGLFKAGHTIGSHTFGHKKVASLDEDALSRELEESASMIEQKLGVATNWFAFPWGDIESIDERSLRLASRRYRFCCSTIPSVNSPETASLILFRMGVDLRSPFLYQRMILAGGLDFLAMKKARSLLKMAIDTKPTS